MKRSFAPRGRPNRPIQSIKKLYLENLEDRTLLDATAFLHHPEAVLRPDFHASIAGKASNTTPYMGPLQEPPGTTPPNILVNDPGEDGNSANDTQSETTIALAGNSILAGYNDSFRASSNRYTGFSRSDDGGNTFTDLGSFPTSTNGDAGDPIIGYDTTSGRTYFASLAFNGSWLNVWRSDDNLTTIMPAVNGAPGRSGLDKEWLVVDNNPGAGQGNVYLVVRDFSGGNGIYFFRSTDQGATFGPNGGVLIASGSGGNVQGAWVTVGPDHTVYASWYDDTAATASLKIRSSTDGGQTFGPASTITTLQTTGTNGDLSLGGFRSNAFGQVVVNPVTNQLYVAYDDKGVGSDRADVYFRTSEDGGLTWDPAIRVVDDTSNRDQWQPALAVTPDGSKVGVFWYDRRNDAANNLIDRYGAIGDVAGNTVIFEPNFRISDTSFPPEFGHDPAITPPYMGDYDQAVADATGFYITWGDNRSRSLGHAGNNQDVRFAKIQVAVSGPAVVAINPRGVTQPPVETLRVTFDEAIDPATATLDQFVITDTNGNPVNIQSVTPVTGNDHAFDVAFDMQGTTGVYSVSIGPFIADTNGNFMDQDGDGDNADGPEDMFSGTFTINGLRVTNSSPTGNNNLPGTVDHVRLTFNEPVNPDSFTTDEALLTGPDGSQLPVNNVVPVDGTNDTQFDVQFNALATTGHYTLVVGPNVLDMFGNEMDQNGNFIPGEPDDAFTTTIGVLGPRVTASTPTGNASLPGTVDHVRLTFNESMDPTSFTFDQVVSFNDPHGVAIPITDIEPVIGSNNTQFDISFQALTVSGNYQMVVGPFIQDTFGNAMDQNGNLIPGEVPGDQYTATFSLAFPTVTSTTLSGRFFQMADHGQVIFNEPIDPSSFTAGQIQITDPHGNAVNITNVSPSDGTNTRFDVTFDTQTITGTYMVTVGPNISDPFGNVMAAAFHSTFDVSNERVVNGGFETGTFMGWTTMAAQQGSLFGVGGNAHTGQFAAYFGGVVEDSFDAIWQDVPTTVGASYTISFWLNDAGGGPSEFKATWGSTTLTDMEDPAPFAYTLFTFTMTATDPTTRLEFQSYQVPSYFYLDDVSVQPTGSPQPGGGPHAILGQAPLATALASTHVAPTNQVVSNVKAQGTTLVPAPAVLPPDARTAAPSLDHVFAQSAAVLPPPSNAVLDPLVIDQLGQSGGLL